MKQNIVLITIMTILMASLLPGAYAINTLVASGSVLEAELLYYEPLPAEPGDVLDVYILVSNEGGSAAKNVRVKLVDNYPFTSDDPLSSTKEIPSIPAQESALVRFKVRIDNTASEGPANLKTIITSSNSVASKDAYLALDVTTNDAAIGIDRITMEPEVVTPGGTAKIDLYLKNLADSRLRDIGVELATQKTVGTTTTALPFAPVGMSLERRFAEMFADQELNVHYEIIVSPSADSDVYAVPITITFSDERGNDYSITDEVALIINAKPELEVYLDDTDLLSDNLKGEFTLKFVNKGLSTIKSATAEIQASEDFELLASTRKVYIGNIDSDDYETETFKINAKKGEFLIPVSIHYMDALNNEYTQDVQLPLSLFSTKQTTNGNGNTGVVVVIVVLVLVVLFFVLRRHRKKKKRKLK